MSSDYNYVYHIEEIISDMDSKELKTYKNKIKKKRFDLLFIDQY